MKSVFGWILSLEQQKVSCRFTKIHSLKRQPSLYFDLKYAYLSYKLIVAQGAVGLQSQFGKNQTLPIFASG